MNLNQELSKYIVNTSYSDLPEDVIELSKRELFDTIGVATAGVSEEVGSRMMPLALSWGGTEQATIIGSGKKVPAPLAALVNGAISQALDYDAIIFSTGHVGVCIIPAVLAAAETVKATGKEIITAIALGIDVMCRFGEASIPMARGAGWLYTPLFGCFGATAAAAKLLKLNEEETANALGIAYSQACGSRQPVVEGKVVKPMQSGFAARIGVVSALFAKEGVTGSSDFIEGPYGLAKTYLREEFNPEILVKDFGSHFCARDLAFKNHPACGATECSVEAALVLTEENKIDPKEIDHVDVHVGIYSKTVAQPLEAKQNPQSGTAAIFSIPWTVAISLVKQRFTLHDMGPRLLGDADVRAMAKKVNVVIDVETSKERASFPGRVEVTMKDGTVYTKQVDFAKGHPTRPFSREELIEKYLSCNEVAKKKLSDEDAQKYISLCYDLENAESIDEIMALVR